MPTALLATIEDYKENAEVVADAHEKWISEGRDLAKQYNRNAWDLADWISHGYGHFNYDDVLSRSDRWMAIGSASKMPNFYRDTAAQVGLSIQTLKNRCFVAGRFPEKKDRIAGLTFSHHAEAAVVENPARRKKYLLDCFHDDQETGKPLPVKSVAWLRAHIAECENKAVPESSVKRISLKVSAPMFEKLELLAWDEADNKRKVDVKAYLMNLLKEFLAERQANIEVAKEARRKRGKKR
jgi:hypothetical protein